MSKSDIEAQHKRIMARKYRSLENGKECRIIDMSSCTAQSPWVDVVFSDGSGTYTVQFHKLEEIQNG